MQPVRFEDWVLPPGETHLQSWMKKVNRVVDGRRAYQFSKYEASVSRCRQKRVAVDVGAHVGLLAYWMARDFEHVHAFEPVAVHRQCFSENMKAWDNVALHPVALGESEGHIRIHTNPTSSGDSWVDGTGDIPMKRLDDYELAHVDYLKCDVEGHELFVLRGAKETLQRWRPVVMVEQKPGRAQKYGLKQTEAVTFLEGLGYRLVDELSGDYILV